MAISESGHWYTKKGVPAYTQITKSGPNKGKARNTTLRDAKKQELLPSVTTVLNVLNKPALNIWKQNQMMLACMTLPRNDGEAEADYIKRVIIDSQETARKSAEQGTKLHAIVEQYFQTGNADPDYMDLIENIEKVLPDDIWLSEKSCVHLSGFGGKVDLHSMDWVIDFKTKDNLNSVKCYDEHYAQLAAYKIALGVPAKCANVFIDRNTHEAVFVEHSEEQTKRGWSIFKAALDLWKILNNYDSGVK